MYFGSYYNEVIEQSGKDWVQCVCGRWLHEDYAEDHRVNQSGQDRFCYSCLDLEIFVLLFPKVEYTFLLVHHVCGLLTIFVIQNLYRCVRASRATCDHLCSINPKRKAFIGERKLAGRLIVEIRN